MKQLEILDHLPIGLRYELIEDITAKTNLQSELARKQLAIKEVLQKHTRQGTRTDLKKETSCTPDDVQVASRRESTAEKVAAIFQEGAGAVRCRLNVYEHAQADPIRYGKYLQQMDRENSPYKADRELKAAQQAERFDNEIVSRKVSSLVLTGDFWNLSAHRLYCGDATSPGDVDRLLGGAVPHLMVTDPPYGVTYRASWRRKIGNKNSNKMGKVANDDRHDWSDAWALFPGDVAYVWFSGRHAASVQLSLEKHQLLVRNLLVWDKTRPVISRGHYCWQGETCFYAVRDGKVAHWNSRGSQSNIWKIDNREDRGHGHSTQKPVECMLRAIQNNSRENDAVYDPFLGSRTTIIAAEVGHRKCYAMDIDPQYCAIAIERWQNWTGQQATLASTGQTYADVMRDPA